MSNYFIYFHFYFGERWGYKMDEKILKIGYEGVLKIGQFKIPCYVTEDNKRVLSGRGIQEVLKLTDESQQQTSGSRLKRLFNYKPLKALIENNISPGRFEPIKCVNKGKKINGYDATMLVDICDIIIERHYHRENFLVFAFYDFFFFVKKPLHPTLSSRQQYRAQRELLFCD